MRTTTYFPKNFLAILFFIFLTPAGGAQPLNRIEGNNIDKLTPFSKVSHEKIRKEQYDLLINRTRTTQSAKVIIQLEYQSASPVDRPGLSRAAAAKAQEKGIKQRLDAFALKMNLQGRKKKQFKHIPFLALDVDETLLETLMQSDEVLSISEDTLNRMSLDASIPYIDADFVWSEGHTAHNQTVAILDSGVDANHIFLSDPATGSKVISEACYSTTYSAFNATALCSDGSTFPGSGANCTGFIGCDHGTHVAGIVAGNGNDFSGVAKDASLIAIQVFSGINDSSFCGTSTCIAAFTSDIIQGLERVYSLAMEGTYSIASVNLSLGGGGFSTANECDANNQATKQIIDNLRSVGVATIIASGNESFSNKISAPGCISSAISVGATNNLNSVASFSNSANWLTLLAPGVSIRSSVPNDSFSNFSGTSMATPHVAGAFALLKSKTPSATVDQLLAAMVNTGRPIIDSRNGFVTPRIKLDSAADVLGLSLLPANIILDNDFDGTQIQGQFDRVINTQSYNGSALEGVFSGLNTFRFTPILPQSGNYRVYSWWPALSSNTNTAVFTIKHDDGETQINVNQQTDGSQWVELGVFSFSVNNPAYVELSDSNSPTIIVDAMRFEFLPLFIETSILPAGTTGVEYNYSLEANGGLLPFSWDIITGSLPSGLLLQTNGTISGTSSQVEISDFTVQVTDNAGNIATQALSLSINASTEISLNVETTSLSNGTVGTPYTANLTASGGTPPYIWNVIAGSLPTGLSLQNDGNFSGSPSQVGPSDFTVQVTDNLGNTATQILSLNIASSTNLVFEDDFESGTLSSWHQLQSGSVQLVNDPVDGWILRKVSNDDPHGGWAPLVSVLNDFELTLHTRKLNSSGSNTIRYSITDADGYGYGIRLNLPSGLFTIKRRIAWVDRSISTNAVIPDMAFNQWYTIRLSRQGNTLSASVYIGQVDPAQAIPVAELAASNSRYSSFTQVNINGGYEFDTDNIRISD